MEASSSLSPSSPISVPGGSGKKPNKTRLERIGEESLQSLQRLHPAIATERCHLIGVSGGRDSVALLHLLLANGFGHLVLCHVDHGLRGEESSGDSAHVRDMATTLGLPFELLEVDVKQLARSTKTSVETAGRRVRREFFHSMAAKYDCQTVFLAHHANDDVETILHNLFRGTSLHGAAGISPAALTSKKLLLVRPLLAVFRQDVDEFVTTHQLAFREDSSNQSLQPTRNRLRHEVLPLLRQIFQRDVSPAILRFAHLAREDDALICAEAEALMADQALLIDDGSLRITPAFQQAPVSIKSRILRHWLRNVHQLPNVGFAEIVSALSLFDHTRPAKINLPGGWHLRRKAKRFFVDREHSDPAQSASL